MLVSLNRILEDSEFKNISLILCYPNPTDPEVRSRIEELSALGVEAIIFKGKTTISRLPVLGKGHVGIVVAALCGDRELALKVRRVDADRRSMRREAEMLERANRVSVGPRLFDYNDNFLLMDLVEGTNLTEWLMEVRDADRVRETLRGLMEKCRRLDEEGVDHGELSRAHRHVLVAPSGEARILDFETASASRRVSNVTSIANYLFFNKGNYNVIKEIMGEIDLKELRSKLRKYKTEPTDKRFREILAITHLET